MRRLLHSGARTSQIIDMYISMIRTLRIIDSSDLLLNYVAKPVRAYLRDRSDTVRCVVGMLLQGRSGDLHSEMRKGGSLEYGQDEEDEDNIGGGGAGGGTGAGGTSSTVGNGAGWEPRKRDPDLDEGSTGTVRAA